MSWSGADPGALDGLAGSFEAWADTLDRLRAGLNGGVHTTPWKGPEAESFRAEWDSVYYPRLAAAVVFLRDGRSKLQSNADQQRNASGAGGGTGGAGHAPPAHVTAPRHSPGRSLFSRFRSFIDNQTATDIITSTASKAVHLVSGVGGKIFDVYGVVTSYRSFLSAYQQEIASPSLDHTAKLTDTFTRFVGSFLPAKAGFVATMVLDAGESKPGQAVLQSYGASATSGFFDVKSGVESLIGHHQAAAQAQSEADLYENVSEQAARQL